MAIMAARIVVLTAVTPILPASASATVVHDGMERTWLSTDEWREYRHPNGNPIVVHKVASVTIASVTYVLCIFWGHGGARDAIDGTRYPGVLAALRTANRIVADWAVTYDAATGRLLCTQLEADPGAAAAQVMAAWPAAWRALLGTDPPGGPPTGPRMIGVSVA